MGQTLLEGDGSLECQPVTKYETSGLRTETVPLQILLPRPHGVSD